MHLLLVQCQEDSLPEASVKRPERLRGSHSTHQLFLALMVNAGLLHNNLAEYAFEVPLQFHQFLSLFAVPLTYFSS